MKTEKVAVRKDKQTGEHVLFFKNSNPNTSWLECFTRSEGHSEPSRDYMLRGCAPVSPDDPQAQSLAQFWESIGPDRCTVKICRRL